jgi:hypothetical protein
MLLREQGGDDVQITREVVKAAAENSRSGKEVMMLLLEQRGGNFRIAEGVLAQIAGLFDKEIMTLLPKRREDDIQIIEEGVKVAAGNWELEGIFKGKKKRKKAKDLPNRRNGGQGNGREHGVENK